MFEAVCVISEFSVAESASVWLFSSMDIHVRFESLLLHKTLVTNGALKGHVGLVGVLGQHVPFEINTFDLHATEGALLEDGFLTQPEKGVERVYLGVALAKLRLGEFSLVLAEPVDADEPVNDSVVIFVFDGTFNL